jgi:nucleoside-diphosphate-sugar epimerase
MRIFVIGGTGFIGGSLIPRLLDAGHEVAVLHRPEGTAPPAAGVRSIRGDRRRLAESASALRAFGPDVVVDLILSSGRQATALMHVFRGHAGRVLAITSMDVYRATGVLHGSEDGPLEPLPLREDSALRTKLETYPPAQVRTLQQIFSWLDDEYDKIAVERAVQSDPGLPATVLRLPMIYGPGDRLHRFFPLLKRMDERRPVIVMPERVAHWRSPRGYVENVATAIARAAAADHAAGRVYNVGEAESFSELEWARMIAAEIGWTGRFVLVPDEEAPPSLRMPGNLGQHWVVDTTRIRAELGYEEIIARPEAIRRTAEWERAHPPPIDPAQFDYAAEDQAVRHATERDPRASRQEAQGGSVE